MERSKVYALITAAAFAAGTFTCFPAATVSAEETLTIDIAQNWIDTIDKNDADDNNNRSNGDGFLYGIYDENNVIDQALLSAVREKAGGYVYPSDIVVKDIRVSYEWEYTCEEEMNTTVYFHPFVGGTNSSGWVNINPDGINNEISGTSSSGKGVLCASEIDEMHTAADLDDYRAVGLACHMWSDKENDSLTVKVTNISYDVSVANVYSMEFPDISFDTVTIKEASDWNTETNSPEPNGKPDYGITGAFIELNDPVPLEDYAALSFDYTLTNTEDVQSITVNFNGWADNTIGWKSMNFDADGSGTVVIDLSPYKEKNFHQIYAGVTLKEKFSIGDEVQLGLNITNAKLLTSYSGEFTPEQSTGGDINIPDDNFTMTAEEMSTYEYLEITYSPMLKTECSHKDGHYDEDGVEYNQNETYCMSAFILVGAMLKDGTYTGDTWNYVWFNGDWSDVSLDQETITASLYVDNIPKLLNVSYDDIDYFIFEPKDASLGSVKGHSKSDSDECVTVDLPQTLSDTLDKNDDPGDGYNYRGLGNGLSFEVDQNKAAISNAVRKKGTFVSPDNLVVKDIKITYEWTYTGNTPRQLDLFINAGGNTADNEWVNLSPDINDYSKLKVEITEEGTGTDTISASEIDALFDTDIENYGSMNFGCGMWSDNENDSLVIRITNVSLEVLDPNYNTMTPSELDTYDYLEIVYSPMLKNECSHKDGHYDKDGVEYNQNETHCMDAKVLVGAMLKDGTYTGDEWIYVWFNAWGIENKDQDTLKDKLYIKDIYSNLGVSSEDVEYFVFEPCEATLDSLKGCVEEDDNFTMTAKEMDTYKYIEVTYSPMLKTECSHTDGHFKDGVEYNQNETHCMGASINIGAKLKDGTYTGDDWNFIYFHGGWSGVNQDQDTVTATLYVKDISNLLKVSYDEIDHFVFEPSNAALDKVEGYTVENENSLTMSAKELSGYKCLYVTYDVLPQSECGHENHIGDDGKDHGAGVEYCPWAGVSVDAKYTSGGYSGNHYEIINIPEKNENGGYSGSLFVKTEDITKLLIDDEYSETSVAKEAESYIFNGVCVSNFTVTGYDSLPDITLNNGGIGDTVIAESNDWDPELGNVPNGKPDLHPTYTAYSLGNNLVYFEGYNAIKFDYTLEDKDSVDGIVVILHGWMDDAIGWEMLYYEADESGTVVVDLRDIQDKSYNNIFIGVKAKNSFKIGDPFAPGFSVTNAKMLTSYSGEYSETFTPDPSLEECINAIDLLFDEDEDTVVLTDMELRMIEIVLKNDYGTES